MNKTFKKLLSYALGICLALGVGLSYAYAVGANDESAFVTKVEFERKISQMETTLDNIMKTVNDTTMDFFMSGPRLQVSLTEGLENSGGADYYGWPFVYSANSTWNSWPNRTHVKNNLVLGDMWGGKQAVNRYGYYGGDMNGPDYHCKVKYALKSDEDPNTYLIFNYYHVSTLGSVELAQVWYLDISKRVQDYSVAKTFSVTVPKENFVQFAGGDIIARGRTSSSIYTSEELSTMQSERLCHSGNASPTYNALTNPGIGYVTVTTTDDTAKFIFEFPARAGGMRAYTVNNSFSLCPINLNGRKFANGGDKIYVVSGSATNNGPGVYKVFSPQKGCLSLKSYLNGEIPIFNE